MCQTVHPFPSMQEKMAAAKGERGGEEAISHHANPNLNKVEVE